MRAFSRDGPSSRLADMIRVVMSAIRSQTRGTAAVEFAIALPVLVGMVINLFDTVSYVYQVMEVSNAAQMGAQSAWKTCDPEQQQATNRCAGLGAAVTSAVSSTSLGANVSSSVSEAFYCVNDSNVLQFMTAVMTSKLGDCGLGAKLLSGPAGDYITVQASYRYTPSFPLSVTSLFPTQFPTPIVHSSTIRIN